MSLAVNRQEISDKIFFGTRKPADSWANPLTPGAKPGNCTACKFDPETAKTLLAEAGGFTGEMVFYYNADSAHKDWMDAVAQQVKTNLNINARAEGVPTFAVFRQNINAHKMNGPYRAAWQQDYPDVENWVNPLFVTNGSSNDGLYSNTRGRRPCQAGQRRSEPGGLARGVRQGGREGRPGRPEHPGLLLRSAVRPLGEDQEARAEQRRRDRHHLGRALIRTV